jgi:hypothetical protein
MLRLKEQLARKQVSKKRKLTPLAREVELRREEIIRDILGNSRILIDKQFAIADLPVAPNSKDNDTVLKASNSLLDRAFGKPKESIDFSGSVQFSLKTLAEERLKVPCTDVTSLEDMVE